MGSARSWIPIPKLFPLETFPQRLLMKLSTIARNLYELSGVRLGFLGASVSGSTDYGNTLLKLRKNYALGVKNSVIELPKDLTIYESVKNHGSWELEVSRFLAVGLTKTCHSSRSKTALLDIGANTGLITLQAMNLSQTENDVFLFEPVPRHALAIKNNLRNFSNIHINQFALSNKNGISLVFTESTNHGNTSLLKSVVPESGMTKSEIKLVDTQEFCAEFLNGFDSYIIKSDTQGMDALILARIPDRIWKKVECAVIEVWALPEIRINDVENLLAMFSDFNYVSWGTDSRPVELNEIRDFWLGKSGNARNLFLNKTLLV